MAIFVQKTIPAGEISPAIEIYYLEITTDSDGNLVAIVTGRED